MNIVAHIFTHCVRVSKRFSLMNEDVILDFISPSYKEYMEHSGRLDGKNLYIYMGYVIH